VHYRVPFGTLGHLTAGSFVKGDVEKIFDYRRNKIEELFAGKPAGSDKLHTGT
jgi:hypothetical protein